MRGSRSRREVKEEKETPNKGGERGIFYPKIIIKTYLRKKSIVEG